jgi:hypothetical protein
MGRGKRNAASCFAWLLFIQNRECGVLLFQQHVRHQADLIQQSKL